MVKIVTIVGARPQFIKAATVSREIDLTKSAQEILVHTGQHYDQTMSDVFFEELKMRPPNYDLQIGSLPPAEQVGKMLLGIEPILVSEKPDWVLVYGDTNSTLAGTLAAIKTEIPLAHVEAGLRSYNRDMPEEINRLLTDHASDLLFTPTQAATENLSREGIPLDRIKLVGDVMYDAIKFYAEAVKGDTRLLQALGLKSKAYILGTIHRAENTDNVQRIKAIWQGLNQISNKIDVVLPLHPRTRLALEQLKLLDKREDRLHVVDPVSYLEMVILEKEAQLIVTDSGGVQKEAFFHHVPCVTLRAETEWVELVESGWNTLVDPMNAAVVEQGILRAIKSSPRTIDDAWFGDGRAAKKIVEQLTH